MHGITVCALETIHQQHVRAMGDANPGGRCTGQKAPCRSQRWGGGVLGSEGGRGEEMRNIHSGQTDAIVQLSCANGK